MEKTTQRDRVLQRIHELGYITSYDAYTSIGCTQLATRISELKDRGYMFKKESGRKIVADLYIDDRNLGGLPDWGTIYEIINGMPHKKKKKKRSLLKRIFCPRHVRP